MYLTQINKTPGLNNNCNNKPFFQPKLSINQPNDIYEQEADAMADKVMRMGDEHASQQSFFKPSITNVQRKCEHCEEEEKQLHRKEINNDATVADTLTENYISSLNGKGRSLTHSERNFFEPRFGYDFSNVQLHTNSEADQSVKNINALAYTHNNNIVFGSNQYQPDTESGKRLIAHELTHVVQQNSNIATSKNNVHSNAATQVNTKVTTPLIQMQKIPTGIIIKEIKSFGHSDIKNDEDKKKYLTNIGAVTLMQVTPAGDYSEGQKRGDCVKEVLTEVHNTCPAFNFCTGNKCLEVNRFGNSGDPVTGMNVTDGPDTFIDRHVTRMPTSFLDASGKKQCSVVCHQRYKYRTEPDKKYSDLGSFYIIRNFIAGSYTPPGGTAAIPVTTGNIKKVSAGLEAPSKEDFAKKVAPGLVKSGSLLDVSATP